MPVLGTVCFNPEKFAKLVGMCLHSLCTRFPSGWGFLPGTGTPTPKILLQGTPQQAGAGSGWGRGRCPHGRSWLQPGEGAPRWGGLPDAPCSPSTPTGEPAHPPPTSIPLPSSSSPVLSCHFPGAAHPSQPFVPLASILPFV